MNDSISNAIPKANVITSPCNMAQLDRRLNLVADRAEQSFACAFMRARDKCEGYICFNITATQCCKGGVTRTIEGQSLCVVLDFYICIYIQSYN